MNINILPAILEINIDCSSIKVESIKSEIIKEIKNHYSFEEVEMKKNALVFLRGFPVISIGIYNGMLDINCAIIENKSYVDDIYELISLFLPKSNIVVNSIQLITLPQFKNKNDYLNFILNCDSNNLGIVKEASLKFITEKDNHKIEFLLATKENENSFMNVILNNPFEFNGQADFVNKYQKCKEFLIDRIREFLGERCENFAIERGAKLDE